MTNPPNEADIVLSYDFEYETIQSRQNIFIDYIILNVEIANKAVTRLPYHHFVTTSNIILEQMDYDLSAKLPSP